MNILVVTPTPHGGLVALFGDDGLDLGAAHHSFCAAAAASSALVPSWAVALATRATTSFVAGSRTSKPAPR